MLRKPRKSSYWMIAKTSSETSFVMGVTEFFTLLLSLTIKNRAFQTIISFFSKGLNAISTSRIKKWFLSCFRERASNLNFFTLNASSLFEFFYHILNLMVMLRNMGRSVGENKIIKSIIGFVSVNMMDNLFFVKRSFDAFRHNPSVFLNKTGFIRVWMTGLVDKLIPKLKLKLSSWASFPMLICATRPYGNSGLNQEFFNSSVVHTNFFRNYFQWVSRFVEIKNQLLIFFRKHMSFHMAYILPQGATYGK